jgi:hypothetical protein
MTKKSINFNNSPPLQITNNVKTKENKSVVKPQVSNPITPVVTTSLSSNSLSISNPKTPLQEEITNKIVVVTPAREIIQQSNEEEFTTIIDSSVFSTSSTPDYEETWTDVAGINSPSPLRISSRSPMIDSKQLYSRHSPHSMLSKAITENNNDVIPSIRDDITNEVDIPNVVDTNVFTDIDNQNNNNNNNIQDVEVLELNNESKINEEEKLNEITVEKNIDNDEINLTSRNISLSSSIKKLGVASPIPTKKFAKTNRKASMSAVLGRYNDEQLELIPSIYPNGGTGGEVQTHIDRNMRHFRNKEDKFQSNASKPMTKIKNITDSFMSPKEKKKVDKYEGRPSIGTMQAEWDFILETNYGGIKYLIDNIFIYS